LSSCISFIIPVRNDARRLTACLDSIAHARPSMGDVEVIVVDNGSEDDSAQVARQQGARVLVLPGLRVAALRNRAAAVARGDILAFVDADHTLAPGWGDIATADLQDDRVAAAGAPYHSPPTGTWVQHTYDLLRDHRPGLHRVSWLGSGNLAIKKRCFDAAGGFDEALETCEDVDLCQRLEAAGHHLVADSRLVSVHFGDPATLRQLFVSELWRGRNNLRVSFRRRPRIADLPSIMIPIVDLVLLITSAASVALNGVTALPVAVTALFGIAVLGSARAFKMNHRAGGAWTRFGQVWLVAIVYDVARALALVSGVGHRRARPSPVPQAD
jgi:GT2 family glycosyltransferase